MRRRVFFALVTLLIAGCGGNPSPPTSPSSRVFDVTGTWVHRAADNSGSSILTLTQTGIYVSGTYASENPVRSWQGEVSGYVIATTFSFTGMAHALTTTPTDQPCANALSGTFEVSDTAMTGPLQGVPQPPCIGRPGSTVMTYRRE